jgi:hypothetical protein
METKSEKTLWRPNSDTSDYYAGVSAETEICSVKDWKGKFKLISQPLRKEPSIINIGKLSFEVCEMCIHRYIRIKWSPSDKENIDNSY